MPICCYCGNESYIKYDEHFLCRKHYHFGVNKTFEEALKCNKVNVSKIGKQLKGNTSIQLRRCFKHLPYLLWSYGKRFPNLWAKGYYCGSAGHVSQDAVKRYIQEQEGKDVFEYSVFGSSNQKIGDFTQQKLTSFGGN